MIARTKKQTGDMGHSKANKTDGAAIGRGDSYEESRREEQQ